MKGVDYLPLYSNSPYNTLKQIKTDMIVGHPAFKAFQEKTMETFDSRLLALNKDIALNYDDIVRGLGAAFTSNQNLSSGINISGKYAIGVKGGSYSLTSKDAAAAIAKDISRLKVAVQAIGGALAAIDTTLTSALAFDEHTKNLILSGDPEALKELADGHYSLPKSDIKTVHSAYSTLQQKIAELHSVAKEGHVPQTGKTQTEEIQACMRAISGCFNTIRGILFEAESAIGLCQAQIEGLENLQVISTGAVGKGNIAKITNDPNIAKDIQTNKKLIQDINRLSEENGGHPKADLVMSFKSKEGYGNFGISIKNTTHSIQSTANRWRNSLTVGTQKNLYAQIYKAEPYLSSLAGMNVLYYGKIAFSVVPAGKRSGEESLLSSYWYSYLDTVAILNILDSLTGKGGFANTVGVLVVNKKVYNMRDVLRKVLANPHLIYGSGFRKEGSLSRKVGVALNLASFVEDDGDTEKAAKKRSDILQSKITAAFNQASLQTKIDLTLLAGL